MASLSCATISPPAGLPGQLIDALLVRVDQHCQLLRRIPVDLFDRRFSLLRLQQFRMQCRVPLLHDAQLAHNCLRLRAPHVVRQTPPIKPTRKVR